MTSLNQQIRNFEVVTIPELELQMGKKIPEILSQFIFVVGSGGNDYSLNYFLGPANNNVTLEAFTANLTTTLSLQLKVLETLDSFTTLMSWPFACINRICAFRITN